MWAVVEKRVGRGKGDLKGWIAVRVISKGWCYVLGARERVKSFGWRGWVEGEG